MILKNTYLLTTSGWNVIQNLTKGQKICGLLNGKFSYTTITKIEKIKYTGKIYTLNKSPLLPDTKFLTKNQELQNISNIKNIKQTHDYAYSGYRINPIKHQGHLFDTCLIMKIIGYFVECGSLKNEEITFKNSGLKLDYISKTLNQLDIKNRLGTSNKGTLLYSKDKYLYDFLIQFHYGMSVQGPYKYIPKKFLTLDKCYLEWLLCSMFSSSTEKNVILRPGNNILSGVFQFITNSKLLTDNLHDIAIKLGYYFNTTIIYSNPMRREQYNPLTSEQGTLTTYLYKPVRRKTITGSELTSWAYRIYTEEELEFTLIRNNSKPLFVVF